MSNKESGVRYCSLHITAAGWLCLVALWFPDVATSPFRAFVSDNAREIQCGPFNERMAAFFRPIFSSSSCYGQDLAVKVYNRVSPSVVSLANIEGSGTGVILNDEGFILTNAHVVASPLPYKCKIDLMVNGKPVNREFKKVEVLGTHPKLDLALVKINPSEHAGKLVPAVLAKEKGSPGQTVFAIGNPGAIGQILNKTITSGLLSGVDRIVEKESYYQVDAAINPGNSGGPLVNSKGEVLGIVTFKSTDAENVGFAIPMHDFKPARFNSMTKSKSNKSEARQYAITASQFHRQAIEAQKYGGQDSDDAMLLYRLSSYHYHRAINHDPMNPDLFYNCGLGLRNFGESEIALAYFLHAIRLEPWGDVDDRKYRELGLIFAKQKKLKIARMIYWEAVNKYPVMGAKSWEDLAIGSLSAKEFVDAAYECAVVMHLRNGFTRPETAKGIFTEATAKMNENDKNKLRSRIANLEQELLEMKKKSYVARRENRVFMTKEFEEFMTEKGGLFKANSLDLGSIKFHVAGQNVDLSVPRIWKDATGKHEVNAKFTELKGGKVYLLKVNGVKLTLPLRKLSESDQKLIEQFTEQK